jgi:3-oxoacyl-[acyl-carrier protein] reductase
MLLRGKTAVITGCMQGIGYSCMQKFASEGANIWACCQKKSADFEAAVAALAQKHSVQITPLYFDLLQEVEIKEAMKEIIKNKVPVNILVNIAGMTGDSLFQMMSMETLRKTFEVNLFSQLLITQYVVKLMSRFGGGSIINVSSISALDGNPGQTVYSATKAAWIGVTKTLAAEIGSQNIRVNAIAPGVIDTPMTANLPESFYERQLGKAAIRRLGKPEEVADLMVFLGSDQSSYITGQVIRIDGGIG